MTTATEPAIGTIPPLADGDRLDRAEFHRRYEAMPPNTKWELIEGVVVMASPVLNEFHSEPHDTLHSWLRGYATRTPGTRASINPSIFLDDTCEPQPDSVLRILPEWGGRSRRTPAGYIEGAVEFVAEVANTTARIDLGRKRAMYERSGTAEYFVWRVRDNTLHWFTAGPAGYEPIRPDPDGLQRSRVFPGFWLDPAALLADDARGIDAALDAGCGTPDHAAFAAALVARRTQGGHP